MGWKAEIWTGGVVYYLLDEGLWIPILVLYD